MSEPLTDESLVELRAATEEIIRTFGDNWPLDYEDQWPDVSCRYEDAEAPFTDVWIELFSTGQRPDPDKDHSPLAEWLASTIKVVPALLAEVERLRTENAAAIETVRHLRVELSDWESWARGEAEPDL